MGGQEVVLCVPAGEDDGVRGVGRQHEDRAPCMVANACLGRCSTLADGELVGNGAWLTTGDVARPIGV